MTSSVKMPQLQRTMVGCDSIFSPSMNVSAEKQPIKSAVSATLHSQYFGLGPAARHGHPPPHHHHLQYEFKTTAGKEIGKNQAGDACDRNTYR